MGGLLIEFSRDVQGLPTTPKFQPDPRFPNTEVDPNGVYTGSIQLGATGALGSAVNFGLDDFTVDDDRCSLRRRRHRLRCVRLRSRIGRLRDPRVVAYAAGCHRQLHRERAPSTRARSFAPSATSSEIASGMLYLALMFAVLSLCIAPVVHRPRSVPRAILLTQGASMSADEPQPAGQTTTNLIPASCGSGCRAPCGPMRDGSSSASVRS